MKNSNIQKPLDLDDEYAHVKNMTTTITPVLQELWDNDKDASYDNTICIKPDKYPLP